MVVYPCLQSEKRWMVRMSGGGLLQKTQLAESCQDDNSNPIILWVKFIVWVNFMFYEKQLKCLAT